MSGMTLLMLDQVRKAGRYAESFDRNLGHFRLRPGAREIEVFNGEICRWLPASSTAGKDGWYTVPFWNWQHYSACDCEFCQSRPGSVP